MAYNKYYLQKKQVSYDNGLTWEDVTPSETRQGAYIDSYQTLAECEFIPYEQQYLTFVAEADNLTVGLAYARSNVFQYSVDSGQTWSNLANSGSTTSVNSGQTIMFKATGLTPNTFDGIGTLNPSVSASVQGNTMSLVYGDNFIDQTEISNYQFRNLFAASNITSAENLILPATTLKQYCYADMFNGCDRLTTAPVLPATTLVNSCYYGMFLGCTSLNYIKCLATSGFDVYQCTGYWVYNVSDTGTFVKDANTTWTTGDNGIPSGWTVIDNS